MIDNKPAGKQPSPAPKIQTTTSRPLLYNNWCSKVSPPHACLFLVHLQVCLPCCPSTSASNPCLWAICSCCSPAAVPPLPVAACPTVWLNASVTNTSGTTIFGARYKIDETNWDTAVLPGGSTNSLLTSNIAKWAALNGQPFAFAVSYVPGTGYTWNMSPGQGAPSLPSISLSWSSTAAFNVIRLRLQATLTGGSITATSLNLAIKGVSASVCGSLGDMAAQAPGLTATDQW